MNKTIDEIKQRVRRSKPATNDESSSRPPRLLRVAISCSTNVPHPIALKVGETYPADHPLVARWPWAFVDAGLPDYEVRDYRTQYELQESLKAQAIADRTEGKDKPPKETPRPAPVIPLERQVICIRACGPFGASALVVSKDGEPLRLEVGDVADAKWKLARQHPDRFVPMKPDAQLAVEDALMCIADEGITQFDDTGTAIKRRIHRGQLIDKSDELVEIHPSMFVAVQFGLDMVPRPFVVVAGPTEIITDSGRRVGRELADAPGNPFAGLRQ